MEAKFEKLNLDKQSSNKLFEIIEDLYPSCITDGIIDFDLLKELNGERERDSNSEEKFGLFWNGKSDSKSNANSKNIYKTLEPCLDESNDFFHAKNIIIKGDNLETLKILSDSYNNKVDVIYIDPPYNTGKDFIYKDKTKQSEIEYKQVANLVDENNNNLISNAPTNGRFHTNWLNMIYSRLYLARNLLKEDGIIFISIDDNEYARLKLICDEIFGENNFISNLVWVRNPGGQSDNNFIAKTKEYILFYSKNTSKFVINEQIKEKDILDFKNNGKEIFKKGAMLEKGGSNDRLIDRPNLGYVIYYNTKINDCKIGHDYDKSLINDLLTISTNIYKFDNDLLNNGYSPIIPRFIKNTYGRWRMGAEKLLNYFKEGKLIFELNKEDKYRIFEKEIYEIDDPYKKVKAKDFIDFTSNSNGTNEMKKLFINNQNIVSKMTPKPVNLIDYLISFHPNKDALVLDFFAGSGTTGQAVMELNKEDGGNRNFILVQLEEKIDNNLDYKNIAEITIDRIKKSIEKYEYEKDKKFKVFKVKDSNFKDFVVEDIDGQIQLNIKEENFGPKEDTKDLSLIYEIILNKNYELNVQCKQKKENNINYWLISDKLLIFLDSKNTDTIDYSKVFLLIENYWNSLDDEIKKVGITIIFNDRYFIDDQSKVNLFLEINNLSDQIKIEVF